MRRECFAGPQLCLADHAFMAILHVLYPVLQIAALIRQGSQDYICASWHVSFQPVGHEMHGLSDLEPMARHDDPFPAVSGRIGPS
jgi:hypothetical protein